MTTPIPVRTMTSTRCVSGQAGSIVAATARKPDSPTRKRDVWKADSTLIAVSGIPRVSGAGAGGSAWAVWSSWTAANSRAESSTSCP